MRQYPIRTEIISITDQILIIRFENGIVKEINFGELVEKASLNQLKNPVIFRLATVDYLGFGKRWTEFLDIRKAYLWEHGKSIHDPLKN